MLNVRTGTRPFEVLTRTFFAQLFASESVTSDAQLRQAMIGILAFLVLPGLFLLAEVFPAYQITAAVAAARHRPEMLQTALAQICLILATYAMVAVGIISVFTWDALTFNRRDAMVLGPLPVGGTTIVAAKLAALGLLLAGATGAIATMTAIPFALTTVVQFSIVGLVRHFLACVVTIGGAALFVFASMVVIRGAIAFIGRERAAARIGSLLQFVFVALLLCLMVQLESGLRVMRSAAVTAGMQGYAPTAWFLGLFERCLGSSRPDFTLLSHRALLATTLVTVAAIVVSFGGFRRQLHLALAATGPARHLGSARVTRAIARQLAGPNRIARGIADFTILTLGRNRPQQVPIAINAAIGVAVVAAALSSRVHTLAGLTHPRTAVLWIPLVLAYWLTIGLRAAFRVPVDLRAAWLFRSSLPGELAAVRHAVRVAMLAFVVPPVAFGAAVITLPLYGWHLAARHTLLVVLLTWLLVEVLLPAFPHVPFARAYEPGHARLKTRWWMYLLGMFAFAYVPVKVELMLMGNTAGQLELIGAIVAGSVLIPLARMARARGKPGRPVEWNDDDEGELSELAVLNLSGLGMRV